MKRKLSIVMIFVMLMGIVFTESLSVSVVAAEMISKDKVYTYRVINGKNAEITGFNSLPPNKTDILELPDKIDGYTVTSIGTGAFWCVDGWEYTGIKIPETVTYIGFRAFGYLNFDDYICEYQQLTTLEIPSSVVFIGDDAFMGYTNLREINLPENLLYLGDNAFKNCDSLEEVVIPGSVSDTGKYIFSDCDNLKSVVVGQGVDLYNGAFYNCPELRNITIYEDTYVYSSKNFTCYYDMKSKKINDNKKVKINCIEVYGNMTDTATSFVVAKDISIDYTLNNNTTNSLKSQCGYVFNLKVEKDKATNWKSSDPSVAKICKNGKLTTLKKGVTTIITTLRSGRTYKRKLKVTSSPQLLVTNKGSYKKVKSIEIKKGSKQKIKITGKAHGTDNVYKSTSIAKITGSIKNRFFYVKGLKKGTTTLKITVNGMKLKLKVKVK